MSLYPQLLLTRGGGIISDSSKAAQSKDGATIVIGLGGTGVDCLKNFKRQVYSRILPDNYDPSGGEVSIPEYKHIKFWAIDTAEGSIKSGDKDMSEGYDSITKSEFLKISVNDITAALQAHGQLNRNVNMSWLAHEKEGTSEPIAIQDMHDGAGGIRQAGRFAVIYKASDVMNKLGTLISQATSDGHNKISVHIFSGIGGGTGSGCFLDVCYLTKMLLQQKGLAGSATVCGYFFLPDVNLSNPEIATNALLREQIESNGYAAMQELDYCMNFEKNGDQWDQYYNNIRYTTKLPPVDLCHLISAQTVDGNHTDNSYEYAMNVVADYVLEFAAEQGNGFDMDQHRANVAGQVTRIQGDTGAKYTYGVLGASCAAVPYREINTFLATKLFAQFKDIYAATPTRADVDALASKVGLSFNSLFREYTKGAACDSYRGIANQFDPKQLKLGMDPLFAAFNKYSNEIVGKQETNGKNLAHDLDDSYDPNQAISDSSSVVSRIFQQLFTSVLCEPTAGPFMALNMLNGLNNESLVKIVDGIIATNNERIIDYSGWLEQADNRRNICKAAYMRKQNTNNTRDYINAEISWYTNDSYKKAAERFAGVLTAIKSNLVKLANNYFVKLCRVLNNLKDTFAENESALETMMSKNDYDTDYVRPIMTISELLPSMNETLKKTDVGECLKDMITAMSLQPDKWMSEDSFKITKFVNDYMANRVFHDFASRSILAFLEMKYNDDDPTHIARHLEQTEISTLETFSKALFWMDPNYNLGETSTIEYVYVPANESTLVTAANSFKAGKASLTVRTGSLSDRISFMKFYCGVPMYAYKGIEQYELTYAKKRKPGTHLYERGEKHWENMLPSPIPASYDRHEDNTKSEQRVSDAMELYNRAKADGIAQFVGEDMVIRKYDYDSALAGFKKAEDMVTRGRKSDGKQVYETTHNLLIKKDLPVIAEYVIGGTSRGEHIVSDKFVMYPEYQKIAQEEIDKYAVLMKRDEEVKSLFDSEDFSIFKDAFFVGLIKFKPLFNVTLTMQDEYGFAIEHVLCDAKSEMKSVPIYQAYKNFCALDKETKSMVAKLNGDYLAFEDETLIEEIKTNIETVKAKYNPAYVQVLQTAAKNCGDPAGATGFLKSFIMELHSFYDMIKASF